MTEKVVGVNPNWTIIDGNGNGAENISIEVYNARKSFTERVMEEIGDSVPFEILDGGIKDGKKGVKNPQVTVVFIGPKKLPMIIVADEKPNKPQGLGHNIISFLRKV